MIRSARVWDQCQSIWSGRIASRADPFACHAIAPPFNLVLRQGLDCCRLAPYLYFTRWLILVCSWDCMGRRDFLNQSAVNLTAADDNQRGNQEKLGSSLVRTGKALS